MKIKLFHNLNFWVIFLIYALWVPQMLAAPTDEPSLNRLLEQADSLHALKQFDEAKKIYHSVIKFEKNNIHALAGIGKISVAQKNWSEAGDAFQNVLEIDPENLEALYFKGISYRETGKYKALLLRKLDWNKSEHCFKKVIALDSLYQDVLFQLAVLERYRDNFAEAIQLGHRQIQLHPELPEPQVKLFRLYRYFITHTNKKSALQWLEKQPWDHAIYAVGEIFRRENELSNADSALQNLLKKPTSISKQPAYLSLARIYYKNNKDSQAEKYFWRAVTEIGDEIDASLVFEDIKYIITDEELATFRSLKTIAEKKEFFKKLWLSRDPTPAASINYRLAEHYRRLMYAEKYYEFDGFRSWFNNPDRMGYFQFNEAFDLNEEFHDKGLIYIRHGDPNERAITINEAAPSNESWLYYETQVNPRMTFHFLVNENSAGFWRLTPVLNDATLLEDRLTWDNIYYQMLRANELERLPIMNEMAEMNKKSVAVGITTDRHTWDRKIKPIETTFSMATFRGTNNKTILEIYNAISLSDIAKASNKKSDSLELENGLIIHNLNWDEIEKKQDRIQAPNPGRGIESLLDVYRFEVEPDSYRFAFYTRLKDRDLLGGWKHEKQVADYSSSQLDLSDIVLATKIEPTTKNTKFKKNGLLVIPNPTRLFSSRTPVYVYFEIYQLNQDATGKTSFTIDYTLSLMESRRKGILGLFGGSGKSAITTQLDREGDSEFSVEYLAIDASQVKPGEYQLKIKVTDQLNGKSVTREKRIALN